MGEKTKGHFKSFPPGDFLSRAHSLNGLPRIRRYGGPRKLNKEKIKNKIKKLLESLLTQSKFTASAAHSVNTE